MRRSASTHNVFPIGTSDPRRGVQDAPAYTARMLSDWYVAVLGEPTDRALLEDLLRSSPDHTIDRDEHSGEWRLRSSRLAGVPDHEAAWAIAQEVLSQVSEAAGATAATRLRVHPGGLGRTRPDGNSDLFVHPEPAIGRVRAFPPTVLINGQVVGEPLAAKILRLQAGNSHLRLALHFLNLEESWYDLWKAYEAIRDGAGGESRLIEAGWATRSAIGRFRHTANSYAAIGDAARHAKLDGTPPDEPMTLSEADDFVRAILSQWLGSLE